MNEGKLKRENYERLLHWRFGHANSKVLKAMNLIEKSHLNEDCYCCNEAKFKRAPFPKNEGIYVAVAEPYWRLFADGFGGQRSLGCQSHGGAKGGIVFVCPISGTIIVKLYASLKEFPAILYQVLQQVESQGFVCREVMVDTYVVNLSEAVEEVAAMFRTRIIPISAGTLQELAYAERAVRTIGERSRAMLLGASHLPNKMWGCSDIYSAYVNDVLPQPDRNNISPHEKRTGKTPNIEHLHIKVFGCLCQFAPIEGPEHKRASKTEWGYFVGMQWPMCLVYEPQRDKVLSVSRKKIICHEGVYANFDPTQTQSPNAVPQQIKVTADPQRDVYIDENDEIHGVHSVKVLKDAQRNQSMNEILPSPSPAFAPDLTSQPENQGENLYIPESASYMDDDSLLEKISRSRRKQRVIVNLSTTK
jgi:hypothetical protein